MYCLQDALENEFIPALSADAAGHFTRSEQILQEYARKRTMNATELKSLIQEVLHHPEFNADEVDSDMHARLMKAVADGDVEIHDLWKEGDGDQEVKLFTRDVEKVLRKLLGDIRLAGNQHFEFKEYKDSKGNRIFSCDSNGSVSFQIGQIRAGDSIVPVSLVLYIDGTFMKNGIPIRPIYGELKCYWTCTVILFVMSYMTSHVISYLFHSWKPEQQQVGGMQDLRMASAGMSAHIEIAGMYKRGSNLDEISTAWRIS